MNTFPSEEEATSHSANSNINNTFTEEGQTHSSQNQMKQIISGSGYLELYLGPMFAGKTSRLVIELTRMADLGMKVLYINYGMDVRETVGGDGLNFSSHCSSLLRMSQQVSCTRTLKLSEVDVSQFQVVGIDEANFYPDLISKVLQWVDMESKQVYVCGLDGDYLRRPLGQVLELIPHADMYHKIVGCCTLCLRELEERGFHGHPRHLQACFTVRNVRVNEQLLIGGAETYTSVCRYHQLQHSLK